MMTIAAAPEVPAVSAEAASVEAALAVDSAVDSAAAAATAAEASPAVAEDADNNNTIRIRGTEKCQSKKDAHISAAWG